MLMELLLSYELIHTCCINLYKTTLTTRYISVKSMILIKLIDKSLYIVTLLLRGFANRNVISAHVVFHNDSRSDEIRDYGHLSRNLQESMGVSATTRCLGRRDYPSLSLPA